MLRVIKKLRYKRLYNKKDYLKLAKIISKHKIMGDESYIWHCTRKSCNAIITKTKKPFLPDKEWRCKRCNEIITTEALYERNCNNLKKYIHFDKKNKRGCV